MEDNNQHSCGCTDHDHHEHSNSCGCTDHHHEHSNSCGCTDHHHHEHSDSCGCGCDCGCEDEATVSLNPDTKLTSDQLAFLRELAHHNYMPIAQFVLKSTVEPNFESVALYPVFIGTTEDSMETVKNMGNFLQELEDMGVITLDYDLPLKGYAYEEYHNCALYSYFCKTVTSSQGNENFLGDTPTLELGSMGITEAAIKLFSL